MVFYVEFSWDSASSGFFWCRVFFAGELKGGGAVADDVAHLGDPNPRSDS